MKSQSLITKINNMQQQIKLIRSIYVNAPNSILANFQILPKIFKTNMEVNKYLFEENKSLLININNNSPSQLRGKFFIRAEKTFSNDKALLRIATENEIIDSKIIAIGGLGFDSPRHISALLKATKNIANINKYNENQSAKVVAIMPEVEPEVRYAAAENYSVNSDYYPSYILDRVRQFLLPKIIQDDTILAVPQTTAIFTFSMGGREAGMMENALKYVLKDELNLDPSLSDRFMKNIISINIGYAPTISSITKKGFNKIAIFSTHDRAVLLPKDLYEQVLIKPEILDRKLSVIDFSGDKSDNQLLIVINPDIQDNTSKEDLCNHSLGDYLNCIEHSLPSEMKHAISLGFHHNFTDNSLLGEQYFENQ